jgi:hypothetical protein
MRIKELLTEHYVNAFDNSAKQKYADQVWQIMQKSYEKIGGFHSADDIDDLIDKTGLWKLSVRNGHVYAAVLYKDHLGRKSIASGTDGSEQGKRDYFSIKREDVQLKRAWAEVSGPAESVMKKLGAKPIPNYLASALTGKEILSKDEDGYHYSRMISGHEHTKIIYGFAKLDRGTAEKLASQGINIHELPDNVKASK